MRDLLTQETRPQTLARHLQAMQHDTGRTLPAFAADVVAAYLATTQPGRRTIHWHAAGDPYADMRANAQILRRYLDGDHRFPCELEEAFVSAFPQPFRDHLRADLAHRYGLLPVARPVVSASAQQAGMAALFREVGEAGERVSEMLGDGQIGPEDKPLLDQALKELDDVVAVALGLQHAIRAAVLGERA